MAEVNEELNVFIPLAKDKQTCDSGLDYIPSSYVIAEQEGWRLFNLYSQVESGTSLSNSESTSKINQPKRKIPK